MQFRFGPQEDLRLHESISTFCGAARAGRTHLARRLRRRWRRWRNAAVQSGRWSAAARLELLAVSVTQADGNCFADSRSFADVEPE
jgi:hypothetical protein